VGENWPVILPEIATSTIIRNTISRSVRENGKNKDDEEENKTKETEVLRLSVVS